MKNEIEYCEIERPDYYQVKSEKELKEVIYNNGNISLVYTEDLIFTDVKIKGERICIHENRWWGDTANCFYTATARDIMRKIRVQPRSNRIYLCDRKKETLISKEVEKEETNLYLEIEAPFALTIPWLKNMRWDKFKMEHTAIIKILKRLTK